MKYVKTKSSLFYSFAIRWKNGYLFVLSGVSVEKYDIAKTTIIEEFEKFKVGDFSEEKLALAKNYHFTTTRNCR